ncbi:hypothetical protein L596_011223 [Steinernema carpocapsae]|uniref:Uncharacterized protein n=1 Tax=Steinernema carpocapsae TaxID=34508 RepID=A0A4U5NTQ3_STECR|nr:hypothetical protein L596_011223 [Steinernema carpocapsae]
MLVQRVSWFANQKYALWRRNPTKRVRRSAEGERGASSGVDRLKDRVNDMTSLVVDMKQQITDSEGCRAKKWTICAW